jgi:hypothetical protein
VSEKEGGGMLLRRKKHQMRTEDWNAWYLVSVSPEFVRSKDRKKVNARMGKYETRLFSEEEEQEEQEERRGGKGWKGWRRENVNPPRSQNEASSK